MVVLVVILTSNKTKYINKISNVAVLLHKYSYHENAYIRRLMYTRIDSNNNIIQMILTCILVQLAKRI